MCDPPEGWKYGFPKVIPEGVEFFSYLLENGYPEDLLHLADKHTRFWEEEDDRNQTES